MKTNHVLTILLGIILSLGLAQCKGASRPQEAATEEAAPAVAAADADGDGVTADAGDCDDNNADVHPGATEVCGDGLDNDCNGKIDAEDEAAQAKTYYADTDKDGVGDPAVSQVACSAPEGYVDNGNDCDDKDPKVRVAVQWYIDKDNDSYGDPGDYLEQCKAPDKGVGNNLDCDDTDPYVNPMMPEGQPFANGGQFKDNKDNNCDKKIDEVVCTCKKLDLVWDATYPKENVTPAPISLDVLTTLKGVKIVEVGTKSGELRKPGKIGSLGSGRGILDRFGARRGMGAPETAPEAETAEVEETEGAEEAVLAEDAYDTGPYAKNFPGKKGTKILAINNKEFCAADNLEAINAANLPGWHCTEATTTTAEVCTDGTDNDGDTLVDCSDSDCAGESDCAKWTGIALWRGVSKLQFSSGQSIEINKVANYLESSATTADTADAVGFDLSTQVEFGWQQNTALSSSKFDYEVRGALIAYNTDYAKMVDLGVIEKACPESADGTCKGKAEDNACMPLTESEYPELYNASSSLNSMALVMKGVDMRWDDGTAADIEDIYTKMWITKDTQYNLCWETRMKGNYIFDYYNTTFGISVPSNVRTKAYTAQLRPIVVLYNSQYMSIKERAYDTNQDYFDMSRQTQEYYFGKNSDGSYKPFDTGTGWTLTRDTAFNSFKHWGFEFSDSIEINRLILTTYKPEDYTNGVSGDDVYAVIKGAGNNASTMLLPIGGLVPSASVDMVWACKDTTVCKKLNDTLGISGEPLFSGTCDNTNNTCTDSKSLNK